MCLVGENRLRGNSPQMSQIIAYLRTLTDKQDLGNQKTELSQLGRSTAEVIALVNELVAWNIRVIILKQNLDISQHDMHAKVIITLFSLFAELERNCLLSWTECFDRDGGFYPLIFSAFSHETRVFLKLH
jgi:Resolvase, N terminal domain